MDNGQRIMGTVFIINNLNNNLHIHIQYNKMDPERTNAYTFGPSQHNNYSLQQQQLTNSAQLDNYPSNHIVYLDAISQHGRHQQKQGESIQEIYQQPSWRQQQYGYDNYNGYIHSQTIKKYQQDRPQPRPTFDYSHSFSPAVNACMKQYSHQHEFAIQIICKLAERNYSRHFIRKLMFNYIQELKKPKVEYVVIKENPNIPSASYNQKKQENIDWPFKQLYFKRYKTPDQHEMLQFVHHCAEMIQANFKGYITQKRHKLALKRCKKSHDVLLSFIRKWKICRTYNCQKIVEIRKKVREIQKQIDYQEEKFSNRDAKKLKGLYKYLEIYTKMFQDTFKLLMETGMWTLQKNMKPGIKTFKQKQINNSRQNMSQVISKTKSIGQKQQLPINKKSRPNQNKKQNVDQNSNQFLNFTASNNSTMYTQIEDRPIKAAGQYKLNQLQNQSPSKNSSNQAKKQEIDPEKQAQIEKKKQQRLKKLQQMQKRKKYDPRKAIQEQKNRKKELNQQNEQKLSQNVDVQPVINNKKKAQKIVKSEKSSNQIQNVLNRAKRQKTQQKQQQQKSRKTVKVTKKQPKPQSKNEQETRKQTINPKQLVKKASSKVDCWGTKKQPQPDWVKEYKSRLMNRQQSEEKNIENLRKSIQKYQKTGERQKKNIQRQNQRQKQRERQRQRERERQRQRQRQKKQQNQRLRERQRELEIQQQRLAIQYKRSQQQKAKSPQSWQTRQRQIQHLKQKQNEYMGIRKNSGHGLQEQVKSLLQKKKKIKKREAHRPIQQLQQTFTNHYGDRFRNLMPKLSLLAVARSQERSSRIPVLSNCGEFDEWFDELYNSTQYWKMATQNDKIFKAFILS